ncbi:MAG: hypothetical protein ACE5IL_07415 [Myxococcota bacterium]
MRLRRRIGFSALALGLSYLLVEGVVTVGLRIASPEPERYWVFEGAGALHFDPQIGCRLGPEPARFASVYGGALQYVRTLRGNSAGFPDRDDFGPTRPPGIEGRIAVFGDSFSAGLALERNWPDRAEDWLRQRGRRIRLLNFSIDGGGLANWWSISTHIVEAQRYELDGVVFAVFPGDLRRRFTVCETRVPGHPLFGRALGWDPEDQPATLEAALPMMRPVRSSYRISSQQFDAVLRDEWRPTRSLRPVLAGVLAQSLRRVRGRFGAPPPADLTEGRAPLVEDLRAALRRREVPVWVVEIPSRERLLGEPVDASLSREIRAFARRLGATWLDGAEAFSGISRAEVSREYLPHEGHWAQAGSDRFAAYLAPRLGVVLDAARRSSGSSTSAIRAATR